MYIAIAVFFVLFITSVLVFGSHYECEHFAENHKKKRTRHARVKVRQKA